MSEVGKIAISTRLQTLEREDSLGTGLEPGDHIRITIADNGSGIPVDAIPHIFEPFFTTKRRGRDLRRLGYDVFEAEDATEARRVLETQADIDLMLSNVLMPGDMDGYLLADWAMDKQPNLKIMLLSGYTSRDSSDPEMARYPLLRKPYAVEVLADELDNLLE